MAGLGLGVRITGHLHVRAGQLGALWIGWKGGKAVMGARIPTTEQVLWVTDSPYVCAGELARRWPHMHPMRAFSWWTPARSAWVE